MSTYSPVGDLTVVTICIVMAILMFFSYVRNSRSFRYFVAIIGLLTFSAMTDVLSYVLFQYHDAVHNLEAALVRCLFHSLLFMVFVMFVLYIGEAGHLPKKHRKPFVIIAWIIFGLIVSADLLQTLSTYYGGLLDPFSRIPNQGVFLYGYIAFVVLCGVMLFMVRNRIYRKVMYGFYGTILVSFLILFVQGIHRDSSYTVATFLYPVIAMFYTLHSNPYNPELGTVDSKAFTETVSACYQKGQEFLFLSLYLKEFEDEGTTVSEDIQSLVRKYSGEAFRGAQLFHPQKGQVILIAKKKRNPDYLERLDRMLAIFRKAYEKYRYEYKIVIGESIDRISEKNEYGRFIQSIHRDMESNTVHFVNEEDVRQFDRRNYILKGLEDIYKKHDLYDPRVLVYCQPVYNIKTQTYDTAEALMRLSLDQDEMIFPDQFIPLAETYGYIHVLTEIILHKTCMVIKKLLAEGYRLSRISVNVSALELENAKFCEDIEKIISDSGIPGHKVAIELTESQTDSDFILMKNMISELHEQGIKFYLDDFGTGYSNMERIVELPFDIIKFDRSLVVACENSERSKKIVLGMANIFAQMKYAVLYEGVEAEEEEQMCKNMYASYLQGYKYSRPIPIENLTSYFEKQGVQ